MLNKERFHIITYVLRGNDRLLAVCEYTPLSQVSVQQETNLKQVGSCPSAQSTLSVVALPQAENPVWHTNALTSSENWK